MLVADCYCEVGAMMKAISVAVKKVTAAMSGDQRRSHSRPTQNRKSLQAWIFSCLPLMYVRFMHNFHEISGIMCSALNVTSVRFID